MKPILLGAPLIPLTMGSIAAAAETALPSADGGDLVGPAMVAVAVGYLLKIIGDMYLKIRQQEQDAGSATEAKIDEIDDKVTRLTDSIVLLREVIAAKLKGPKE